MTPLPATSGGIGVALGAGGARGLAHVVLLEALDEIGVKPSHLAGSSIGAVIGAAYASGLSGAEIRAHVMRLQRDKAGILARLLQSRAPGSGFLFARIANPVIVDGEKILQQFWPGQVASSFEQLAIPLSIVATDYVSRRARIFRAGPLRPAVAGSMAIPGLVKPVELDGAVLIDGGAVDPLPYESLADSCGLVIACEVTGGPVHEPGATLSVFDVMSGAAQIMQASITREKIRRRAPDILARPPVDLFRALDFFRAEEILRACDEYKPVLIRQIEQRLATV